ncbi:MAG: hypothetical protein Q7T34_00070 [Candidatus Parcubacteria bacterium]|nr:hypothetical protein [Candidatus Parcubacteria bacterium]
MLKKYTQEELWKLYNKLPEELRSVIFAEDTANSIREICIRNDITDERIGKIAEYVGYVLLGLLTPEEIEQEIEEELGENKKQAKKVAQEINRFIFFPVKNSLETLYGTASQKSEGQKNKEGASVIGNRKETTKRPIEKAEEKTKIPPRPDSYREEI